ncbi:MAG: polyprenyl synthetase family protein [Atribacterota bacterium]
MMSNIEQFLKENAQEVDKFVENYLSLQRVPPQLFKALRYGAIGGGKKIRASLLFAAGEAYEVSRATLLPLAAGIEMIHTFSLVHDDLPCMDNDDYRRGKPSMHRAFGEAMGVLVGDALLVEGLSLFMNNEGFIQSFGAERTLEMAQVILRALGGEGMVGGQVLDLEYQGKDVKENEVYEIYHMKTACFIQAPVMCGGIAGGADQKERGVLAKFGLKLGICFQIKDDLLDVTQESSILGKTAGKDVKQDKATLIKIKGMEAAEKVLQDEFEQAVTLLSSLDRSFERLLGIARFIVERRC